jgi:hypothetical protein
MYIKTVTATRYITPLREGGSLPAIIEADDNQFYVLKFRGAGQGTRALIAELVAGEIIRALGPAVPEIVFVELDSSLGNSERDPEIQHLIHSSAGINLALAYLPNALAFEPLLAPPPDAALASAIVWCDAYLMNVDRTSRNPNLLIWNKELWLIDHGAALYVHHTWTDYHTRSRSRFPQTRDHILLPFASMIAEMDAKFSNQLTAEFLQAIIALIPEPWLQEDTRFISPDEHRSTYLSYLTNRLENPRAFVEEAIHAHQPYL